MTQDHTFSWIGFIPFMLVLVLTILRNGNTSTITPLCLFKFWEFLILESFVVC